MMRTPRVSDSKPPYEKLVLGFGVALAAVAYVYWTAISASRGDALGATAASRALFILGASALLALVLRLALYVNSRGSDDPF